jgi:hypothetical protein
MGGGKLCVVYCYKTVGIYRFIQIITLILPKRLLPILFFRSII